MSTKIFNTPILFLIFNRLDTTKQVFESIKTAKPSKLYLASDGPRESKEDEAKTVKEVRDFVLSSIDWDCKIKTLFRNKNLGCKLAVSEALEWFFKNEEMGIILEDDCLPSLSFFYFCQTLLLYYKNDTRVMHIGGTNPLNKEHNEAENSYYFSRYNRIWGWATWSRAFKYFDKDINFWPKIKEDKLLYSILPKKEAKIFEKIFDRTYQNKIDTWDYQWFLCRLLNGLSIIPNVNLVSNLGFNENATHTHDSNSSLSNLKRFEINFPLDHPEHIFPDITKDKHWSQTVIKNSQASYLKKLINVLSRGFK